MKHSLRTFYVTFSHVFYEFGYVTSFNMSKLIPRISGVARFSGARGAVK